MTGHDATAEMGADDARPSARICRYRFILGVFTDPTTAKAAITKLASGDTGTCEVLLVSDVASTPKTGFMDLAAASVTVYCLDALVRIAPQFREALMRSQPFAVLWESMGIKPPRSDLKREPGMQRLFDHIVHRLAQGAAVVIIRVPDPERQLQVSRTMLDAKCEVLFTHEVLQTSNAPVLAETGE